LNSPDNAEFEDDSPPRPSWWLPRLFQPDGRALWIWSSAAATLWAALVSRDLDDPSHHVWGLMAGVGYAACTVLAMVLPRRWVGASVTVLGLVGAVIVPLIVLSGSADYQSEVGVVERSAAQLVQTGVSYLPNPQQRLDYNPYLPSMSLYGLPHQILDSHPTVGFGGRLLLIAGDARIWFAAVLTICLLISWRLLREGSSGASGRFHSMQAPLAIIGWPIVALPLCVSGVDLPTVGFSCLALASASRGRHGVLTGMLAAAACVLKWTAWPVLPVVVALVAMRRGWWHATLCAIAGVAWSALTIVPTALRDPHAMELQVVRFPLGLANVRTPAVSPLLGHALDNLGLPGHIADLTLLALSGMAVSWWTIRRPPHTAVEAANRLSVGLSLVFLFGPASRFGYFVLPAVVWLLPHLAAGGLSVRPAQLADWLAEARRRIRPASRIRWNLMPAGDD
jgi:hypothetical protein